MRLLAIESTCDETAAALVEGDRSGIKALSNVVASSATLQAKYGGVVPEVAAREQIRSIVPVVEEAIGDTDLSSIDGIAVSYGPGLVGSLLVGIETAKALSWTWNKPLFKVDHMFGHVAANWIINRPLFTPPPLPSITLTISGGHTDIHLIDKNFNLKWIGGTLDDAVGEAFDKVARILDLPYPGGPSIQSVVEKYGDAKINKILPRPMIGDDSLRMSFSGLKAAVLRQTNSEIKYNKAEIAADFNKAVAEILKKKIKTAIEENKPKAVLIAGGVAANKMIRGVLQTIETETGVDIRLPDLKYCGDNAVMIGAAAILKPDKITHLRLKPESNLSLE